MLVASVSENKRFPILNGMVFWVEMVKCKWLSIKFSIKAAGYTEKWEGKGKLELEDSKIIIVISLGEKISRLTRHCSVEKACKLDLWESNLNIDKK